MAMRRVLLAASALSILAFAIAAGGLGGGPVAPARAILGMTVEAPFRAPQPTATVSVAGAPAGGDGSGAGSDEVLLFGLALAAAVAVGLGLVSIRRRPVGDPNVP
jgi:hypothetical protein